MKSIRLMLVEHSAKLSEEIAKVLSSQGDVVMTYGSAERALKDLNKVKPDLVIVDLDRPEANVNFLKQLRQTSSVEVVVIGNSEQGKDAEVTWGLGASHYLVRKWVNASQLKHILRSLKFVA